MNEMEKLLDAQADAANRAILRKAVQDDLKAIDARDREVLKDLMPRGSKLTGQIGDESIGTVSYSDPKPQAKVIDMAQLLGWVAENEPESLSLRIVNVNGAIGFLEEYAPGEYTEPTLADYTVNELENRVLGGEKIPGIESTVGAPILSVRPNGAGRRIASEVLMKSELKEIEHG